MEALLAALLEHLVPIIVTVFATALTLIIKGVAKKYGDRLDAETKDLGENLLINLVQQGATFAEQWAHREGKRIGTKVDGNEKLAKAVAYVAAEINKKGLPQLAEQEIAAKVESILGISTLNLNALPELPLEMEENNDEDDYNLPG